MQRLTLFSAIFKVFLKSLRNLSICGHQKQKSDEINVLPQPKLKTTIKQNNNYNNSNKKSADTETLPCQLAYKFKFGQEIIKREKEKNGLSNEWPAFWTLSAPNEQLSSSRNINKYTT